MRFNNQSTFNGRQITNVVDRPVLHKKGKQWITIGLSTLLLAGLGTVATTGGVHAANIQNNNVNSNNINKINNNATPNSAKPSTITSQATNLHKQILNNSAMFQHNNSSATKPTVAPAAKVNPNSTSYTVSNNVKSNVGTTSANNSDSNASTPNYIEDNAHYNLGSYNSRKPVSTEAQNNAYQAYIKANPQLANLYNETANQSSSNQIASSKVASNAPKDNVSASSIVSNSSANSVSANNSKVSSANQISDKKNKPLMLFGTTPSYKIVDGAKVYDNGLVQGTWGNYQNAPKWTINKGTLTISDGNLNYETDNGKNTGYDTSLWPQYFLDENNYSIENTIHKLIFHKVIAHGNLYGLLSSGNQSNNVNNHIINNISDMDLSGLNVSDVGNMAGMFATDHNLTTINGLQNWDTSHVHDMTWMFIDCPNLRHIDLSNFNTRLAFSTHTGNVSGQNGTSMMFIGTPISHIKLGSNVILYDNGTWQNNSGIGNILPNSPANSAGFGLPAGDTNPKDIVNLEDGQAHVGDWTVVGTGNWGHAVYIQTADTLIINNNVGTGNTLDTNTQPSAIDWSKVKHIITNDVIAPANSSNLFAGHPSIVSVNLSGLNNKNVTNMAGMFNGDTGLKSLTLGSGNTLSKDSGLQNSDWIQNNYGSDISSDIEDGQTHQGTWVDNAEIINYIYNGNKVASDTLHAKTGSTFTVSDSPINTPRRYNADNPNQSFIVNGGITNIPVHLASQDNTSVANSIANSASTEASNLANQDKDSLANSIATSLSAASNANNWVSNNSNNAQTADSWVSHNSQSESNASGKASDNSNAISSLVSGLNTGSASATIQNAINSAVNSVVNSANGALDSKASDNTVNNKFSSLFNSGNGTISSVARTVANSLAGSLDSVYETQTAAGSKANSSDITNLTKSGGIIDSVASAYVKGLADKINQSLASYETTTSEQADINSLTNNKSGTISQVASSYANTLASNYASSLTSNSANGKTTISGIASNMIASLFGSSASNSTIASVANSVASSYLTNDIENKYETTSNASDAINWVNDNSATVSSNAKSAKANSTAIASLTSGLASGSNVSLAISSAVKSADSKYETQAGFSSLFGGSNSASTISNIASTVANNLINKLSLSSTYETQSDAKNKATNDEISSLTKSNGTIDSLASQVVSSYASSAVNWVSNYGSNASNAGSWYAKNSTSLNSMIASASSAYTNASNAISSLSSEDTRISANSNSAYSFSNELTTINTTLNKASSAINWVDTNSESITGNISSLASEKTKIRGLAIQAYSVETSELNQINSAVGNKSNVDTHYSNATQAMSQATSAANDAVNDVRIIQSEINTNSANASKSASDAQSNAENQASIDANSAFSSASSYANNLSSAASNSISNSETAMNTSIASNSSSVSSIATQINQDEANIANASSVAASVDAWMTADQSTLSSASESAYSAYSYYSTNSSAIANAIKEASNTSLAQSSFDTAYTNASKAESWINANSGSFSALNTSISTLSGKVNADKQALNTAIQTKANASDISGDINILNNDIGSINSLANQANTLANTNSGEIANLKKNTAITLTFVKNGQLFGTPTTLTNHYIEKNAPQVQGKSNTYNVSSLLENSLPSGYNIPTAYTITLGEDNGIATMNLDNNTVNQGQKKFAVGVTANNDMNTLNLGTPIQQARAWNFVQHGISNNDYDSLSKASANPQLVDNKNTNPVNVVGNPVNYQGNITLNFTDGNNNIIKSINVPYNVAARVGDNVNLLDSAINNKGNLNFAPTNYIGQTISDFDTSNFSYASGNKQSDYAFKVLPSANPNHNANVVKLSPTLTFTFEANTGTETINYIDEATNKSLTEKGSINGADDTQGLITAQKANNLPNDYQIVDNVPFTFNNNGSVNVLVAKKGTANKDNPNDTHSNVPNTKPTNPSDVAYTFTITVKDHYNSDGKQQTKTYQKYVVEKGTEGSTFTINPSDYTTYGYTMNSSDKAITGTITNNGLSKNNIAWNYTAQKASDNNGSANYKPSNHTPSNVKPSDITPTPTAKNTTKANNPSNPTNVNNAKHGYATLYLVEKRNGKVVNVSTKTINENSLDTSASYTINANDYDPDSTGYTAEPNQSLTGHIKTNGSLSNGTATFYYDAKIIAPMQITYENQDGDYINYQSGSDLGKSNNTGSVYQITSSDLATLGAVGETVDISKLNLPLPSGYNWGTNNFKVMLNPQSVGLIKMVLTMPANTKPVPKPASNSNSANASASASAASAETSASNAVASAKANESEAISENNSVNASKASQSAMEIASMFANNVASASNAVANADNTSATDSMEIRSLIAEINTESKSSNSSSQPIYNITINNEPKATTNKTTSDNTITPINRRIPANLYYVYNPENIILHGKNSSIKISRRRGFTGRIIKATKFNGKRAYVVRWHHKNYVVNAKEVRNAYIQVKDFNRMAHGLIKHATVVLRKNAKIYKSIHFNKATRLANVRAGSKFTVVGVKTFGKKGYHQTRLVLSNGCIITANRNYVKFV